MPGLVVSTRRSVFFSFLVFVVFFGCVELSLRIAGVKSKRTLRPRLILRSIDSDIELPFMRPDPELFWSPRPGYRGEFAARPVTINALGLRGVRKHAARAGGILCLGDSITFGYGVGDDETYPALLGRALAARGWEVVNGGVTGYSSHQTLGLLRRVGPRLRPSVVTVCIGWNDRTRRPATDRQYARALRRIRYFQQLSEHVYLFRVMGNAYGGRALASPAATRDVARVPPDDYRRNLEAIVVQVRALGARPAFVDLPYRSRFEGPPPEPSYPATLREVATERGVPLLDVGVLGRGAPANGNESLFIDSLHLSPAGAKVMAQQLVRGLATSGLLERH